MRRCDIDKSSYGWAKTCGVCHPGGGGCEYDRRGNRYDHYAADPRHNIIPMGDNYLDGDYYQSDWAGSGVLEADCLLCHLKGYDWAARALAIQAGYFYEAPTLGAGWYRKEGGREVVVSPEKAKPPFFALDYGRTVIADPSNLSAFITTKVPDQNCCNCHNTPDTIKRGRCWDTGSDVHKAKGLSCTYCHETGRDHEIAKGDIILGTVRDDQDGLIRGCSDCHLNGADERAPTPDHPFPEFHIRSLYCETCHVPCKADSAVSVIDNATTGQSIRYSAKAFFPAGPSNTGPSFSRCPGNMWLPAFVRYRGRIKPVNPMQVLWWGDWDRSTHRVIPIILWRIRDFTGATDENDFTITNSDLLEALKGSREVNTNGEIATYLRMLATAKDRYGCSIAYHTPVLVKGGMMYYLEFNELRRSALSPAQDGFVCCEPFDLSHNVVRSTAIGSNGCKDCHATPSPFFNRKILVDPFNHEGKAIYKEAWEIIGYSRERMLELSIPME